MTINEIRKLVSQFRCGAEIAKRDFTEQPFNDFPNACCGDAAWLVAQYLMDHDFDNTTKYRYVYGSYYYDDFEKIFGHAWLEVIWPSKKKVIVDITSDQRQFRDPEIFPPCAAVPYHVGKSNEFYNLFEIYPDQCYEIFGLEILRGREYARMINIYNTIVSHIAE